jgi:hypothetical protein
VVRIAEDLAARSAPDAVILSPKDVAFFAERDFVQWYGRDLSDPDWLRRVTEGRRIRHAVHAAATVRGLPEPVRAYLDGRFRVVETVGDFALLERRDDVEALP